MCEREAFAIECKYQDSPGTVDEKIPYTLEDLKALPMAGCVAYAGGGFSDSVLHMLRGAPHAAHCLPAADQTEPSAETWELDHQLAMHFKWWDVLVGTRRPVSVAPEPAQRPRPAAQLAEAEGLLLLSRDEVSAE